MRKMTEELHEVPEGEEKLQIGTSFEKEEKE